MEPIHLVTHQTCLAAAEANGMSLRHVPLIFLTKDVVETAIANNHQAIWAMPRKYITSSMITMATQSLIAKYRIAKIMKY